MCSWMFKLQNAPHTSKLGSGDDDIQGGQNFQHTRTIYWYCRNPRRKPTRQYKLVTSYMIHEENKNLSLARK